MLHTLSTNSGLVKFTHKKSSTVAASFPRIQTALAACFPVKQGVVNDYITQNNVVKYRSIFYQIAMYFQHCMSRFPEAYIVSRYNGSSFRQLRDAHT